MSYRETEGVAPTDMLFNAAHPQVFRQQAPPSAIYD
jgi:hypothetical protein